MGSSSSQKPANTTFKVRFANVSPEEAADGRNKVKDRQKIGLSAKESTSSLLRNSLVLSETQRDQIEQLYRSGNCPEEHLFFSGGDSEAQSQKNASALLAMHGLNVDSRDEPTNRWSIRWSSKGKENVKSDIEIIRVLYQWSTSFTECLAHAEVTYLGSTEKVLRIRGYFNHNKACKDALMTCIPKLPLHLTVFQVALDQLLSGVHSFSELQKTNQQMIKTNAYPDKPQRVEDWRHRWLLQRSDSRSLYRQLARLRGVKTKKKPHINVQEWLDSTSSQFNPTFKKAIFHFSARTAKSERFEVCVATDEMHHAAWRYGNKSGIYLDGTFGLCDDTP
ncbi:hypothetical protein GGU10DRAFT_279500 [Lentinula aff. detonsa]|uniref:Uncharacterized protein n=1 Tax=Lentinula aff. detonsa TaxID=2804958 RepID=A0AA38NN88_9AGAR|nr:hypothetical protein GGU10DRAFT_279500 [Lentinula aff. detonsa]